MATWLPALERTAIKGAVPGTEDLGVWRDDAFLQPGNRHHYLERRTGRVRALNQTVLHGLVRISLKTGPLGTIEASCEHVRVVRRKTRQRQYFARLRVEEHAGA